MVKTLVLRCPRCTARFEVPITRTRRLETCPSCGITLPPAPQEWSGRDDLAELTPGVATELVGAPRKNWKIVVFSLASLGIYAFVYNFVAFDELDRQHRRRHATGLYLAGLLSLVGIGALGFAPFLYDSHKDFGAQHVLIGTLAVGGLLTLFIVFGFAYLVREVHNLQGYRTARGLDAGTGPLPIVLLSIVPYIGWTLAAMVANGSIRELWTHLYNDKGVRIPLY